MTRISLPNEVFEDFILLTVSFFLFYPFGFEIENKEVLNGIELIEYRVYSRGSSKYMPYAIRSFCHEAVHARSAGLQIFWICLMSHFRLSIA